MAYIGTTPKDIRSFGKAKFDFTASQGQTAFTGVDDDGKTLGFTDGQISVYVNGILMDDSDYTTSNSNTVTLTAAANASDIISIVALQTDIPNSDYVPATGGTFSGNVTVNGTLTSDGLTVDGVTTIGFTSAPSWDTNSYLWSESGVGLNVDAFNIKFNTGIGSRTERMRIDSAGRVTKPWQPIWGGRHSGGNLNGFVTMYNDGAVTNGSGWILSGGINERLYPPVSGWYQVTMTGLANPSVSTSLHTQAYLYKSGVSQYNLCAGTTDYTRMILHAYLYLTPTDWISFYSGGSAMHTDQAYNKVTCMLVA